ncbi:MAG: type II secretion system protein N [Azonexus sp.]|jgi:general secretion pathway protein N|nr:type II secretion system protein N [Azonexus sp.]
MNRTRRFILWSLAGMVAMALTALAFLPAAWLAPLVERETGGRLTLGDAEGTVWRGSALIGGKVEKTADGGEAVTPLLPGRFVWRLSPLILLGQVDLELANPDALGESGELGELGQPLKLRGNWRQFALDAAALRLPGERLASLGAPLNTIQPAGRLLLAWGPLQFTRLEEGWRINGSMNLRIDDLASRLSPIKPLGSYRLALAWQGEEAPLTLTTAQGPLLLNGNGVWANGRLRFSGAAAAAAGQEEGLANLLNLLGQPRREGDKNVIGLEFK